MLNKLFDIFRTYSTSRLQKSMTDATDYLHHNKTLILKQKKDVSKLGKSIKSRKINHVFNGYSPDKFDELVNYVKNFKGKKIYEDLYVQNIPKLIIDNVFVWIQIDDLKYKDVKKLIKKDNFKSIKPFLKQYLAKGFMVYDLYDKLIEKGWSKELADKLLT